MEARLCVVLVGFNGGRNQKSVARKFGTGVMAEVGQRLRKMKTISVGSSVAIQRTKPLFKHYCVSNSCIYLGSFNGHDMYFCSRAKQIIVRYGEYSSLYAQPVDKIDFIYPRAVSYYLHIAYLMAKDRNLI